MQASRNLVAIPIYNEEANIFELISNIPLDNDILIINDHSSDSSLKIIKKINDRKITLINNSKNIGYDECIKKAYNYFHQQKYEYFCTIDGDNELNPKYLKKVFKYLENYDLVIGNRNKKNRFSEHVFSFLYSILFQIKDPLCGMKGYRKIPISSIQKENTYGIAYLNFFIKKKLNIKNLNIEINKQRRLDSRIGNSIKVDLKILSLLFSSIWYIFFK